MEKITAHPNFFILATMNPGGDYGKKELSPALRNRLTEIWVPPVSAVTELRSIALERQVNLENIPEAFGTFIYFFPPLNMQIVKSRYFISCGSYA